MARLKRRIGFLTGVGIAVSMVVGSGLFGLPGVILQSVEPHEAVLGWVLAALAVAPLVYVFSFLGVRYPVAEGVARYAEVFFGRWAMYSFSAVACGAVAMGMPAFFLVIGSYLAELFSLPPQEYRTVFAAGVVVLATLLNLRGPERAALLNRVVVPATVVFVLGLTAYYLPVYRRESMLMADRILDVSSYSAGSLWLGAAIAFWAFQGWENLSFVLEEVRNPSRIPRIYWTSFLLILVIYLPFIWVVSAASYSGADVTGLSGLAALFGGGAVRGLLLAVVVGVLVANSISWTLGVSRIAYAAARRGLLPRAMSRLHRRLPRNSLIACALYYLAVMLVVEAAQVPLSYLFLLTTQGFIILYAAAVLAFLKVAESRRDRCAGLLALLSCSLLLTGFSWLLAYSLVLAVFGYLRYRRKTPDSA